MRHSWMLAILVWMSLATPTLCQSGDWGSGFDPYPVMTTRNATQPVGDEPEWMGDNKAWTASPALAPSPPPILQYEPRPEKCSVHFSTGAASAGRLKKAQKEELAFLQAIQDGNKAVMENMVQFVGAELESRSYEDVIRENIIGIQEDQKSCHEVVEKAEEHLEKQLEGEASGAGATLQKIREESVAFEDMLRAAAGVASRLEISSRALHDSFSKQLRDIAKIHR